MKRKIRQTLVFLGGVVLLGAVSFGVLYGIQSSRFSHWVSQDAGTLQPYPQVLVAESKTGGSLPDAELDPILVGEVTHGRLVVELSRSEYRHDLLGHRAWTKVHLVTSKPGDDTIRIQIKLLVELAHGAKGWEVEEVRELALP